MKGRTSIRTHSFTSTEGNEEVQRSREGQLVLGNRLHLTVLENAASLKEYCSRRPRGGELNITVQRRSLLSRTCGDLERVRPLGRNSWKREGGARRE